MESTAELSPDKFIMGISRLLGDPYVETMLAGGMAKRSVSMLDSPSGGLRPALTTS